MGKKWISYLGLTILLSVSVISQTTYYISPDGNDINSGKSKNEAWLTITKLNSELSKNTINPGDIIAFRSNGEYRGSIQIANVNDGTNNKLVIESYDAGEKPVITGSKDISGMFTQINSNTWSITDPDFPSTNITSLYINRTFQPIGRYPHSGFLSYESAIGKNVIIDDQLNDPDHTWDGAEVVIRTLDYVIDVLDVKSQIGSKITTSSSSYYNFQAGFGYFFQNSKLCLINDGDWMYNKTTKTLTVHYSGDLNAQKVEIPVFDNGIYAHDSRNLNFKDLKFTHFNFAGVKVYDSYNVSVENCDFKYNYNGIYGYVGSMTTTGCVFDSILNNGSHHLQQNILIDGNKYHNIGLIPGMGDKIGNDDSYMGIIVTNESYEDPTAKTENPITNNVLVNIGYSGICFNTSPNVFVQHNYIDNFCTIKNDGGAIYTGGTDNPNCVVDHNIVLNTGDASDGGIFNPAAGIYLDYYVDNVTVTNNTVFNAGHGILGNGNDNTKIRNNNIYNCYYDGIFFRYYLTNSSVTRNTVVSGNTHKISAYYYDMASRINTVIDSNYYISPWGSDSIIKVDRGEAKYAMYFSLDKWLVADTSRNQDKHSITTPIEYSNDQNLSYIKFLYNPSSSDSIFKLPSDNIYIDKDGIQVYDKVTVAPFESVILFQSGKRTSSKPESQTFYIDPMNLNDDFENGSIEHPFDSWNKISWEKGNAYLQKRGTESNIADGILVTADSVTIGAYGEGNKPIINSTTSAQVFKIYDKKNIKFQNLNISGPDAQSCIYFLGQACTNIIVEKCIFSGASIGIRAVDGNNFHIQYNTFDNSETGIYSMVENINVFYNIFKNSQSAINLASYLSNANIFNNVFYGNSQCISSSYSEITIYNNIFYLNNAGDKAINQEMDKILSNNNIFYPEQSGFIEISGKQYNTLKEIQEDKNLDMNSLTKDPKFTDSNNNDFSVQPNSPAIDAGKIVGIVTDFFGSSVPNGNGPDIGIHESDKKVSDATKDISGNDSDNEPLIYPNPSNGIFRIQANEYFNLIKIINTEGKILKQILFNNSSTNSYNIDISEFPKGNYILNLITINSSFNQVITTK